LPHKSIGFFLFNILSSKLYSLKEDFIKESKEKNPILNPFSTFPLHSAEKAPFRGKSFSIKVLDTIPDFCFPFRLPFLLRWEAHSIPIRNQKWSPLHRNTIIIWCRFQYFCTSQKRLELIPHPHFPFPFFESKIPTFGS